MRRPRKPDDRGVHMPGLLKQDREFVVPGEEIVNSMEYLPGRNSFREGNSIIARRIGIVSVDGRVISVIPFNMAYVPRSGDMVIGQVTDIQSNGWQVDIEGTYSAYLPLSGIREFIDTTRVSLSKIINAGDYIYAKVSVANNYSIHLSMQDPRTRRLRGGRIIRISPAKVPRLIGKEGSMITMIKNRTNCRISVGQNGFVWLEGEGMERAIKAINLIEAEAYKEGLTDRVAKLLGVESPKREPRAADGEVMGSREFSAGPGEGSGDIGTGRESAGSGDDNMEEDYGDS